MTLGKLIKALESADPNYIAPRGFADPDSYRGYYDELAFIPVLNVSVHSMLEHAKSALGTTFMGYKGGNYTMGEYTECWIAPYGSTDSDRIGPTLIAYLTGKDL